MLLPAANFLPQILQFNPQTLTYENSVLNHAIIAEVKRNTIPTQVPEISYQYVDRLLLPKGPLPPVLKVKVQSKKRKKKKRPKKNSIVKPLKNLIKCLCQLPQITKLSTIFSYDGNNLDELFEHFESEVDDIGQQSPDNFRETRKEILLTPIKRHLSSKDILTMLPSMPHLGTPFKNYGNQNKSELSNNHDEALGIENSDQQQQQSDSSVPDSANLTSTEAACNVDQEGVNEKVILYLKFVDNIH